MPQYFRSKKSMRLREAFMKAIRGGALISLGKLYTRNGNVRTAAPAATPPIMVLRKFLRFILVASGRYLDIHDFRESFTKLINVKLLITQQIKNIFRGKKTYLPQFSRDGAVFRIHFGVKSESASFVKS